MQKKLPENRQAEAALLGSMLLDSSNMEWLFADVPAEAFYWPQHRVIYEALQELVKDPDIRKVDLIMLSNKLGGRMAEVDGVDYLVELVNTVPSADSAEYYARIVLDKWRERLLYLYASELATNALSGEESVTEKYIGADKGLRDLVSGNIAVEAIDVKETIGDISFEDNGIYTKTDFRALDEKIYGLGEGDMITIAGRPGMGKTGLMLDIALQLSAAGKSIAIFSMEMTPVQLQQRMLCILAQVDLGEAVKDLLENDRKERLIDAKHWIYENAKIYIDSTPRLTPGKLRAKVLGLKLRKKIDVVFIDYIQLMKADGKRDKNRYETITDASNGIKDLAIETKIPIVVCAQLSREVEKREKNKRPRLSDLRDSGAIEQDSDVVLLLYRSDYYTGENTGGAELNIAKNRRGKTGTITLTFVAEYVHFESERRGT